MAVLQCGAGVGVTIFFTLWEVSLQEHVPGEALSRVSSFDYLSATALMPVGTALAGPIAAAVGTQATLLAMSAIVWRARWPSSACGGAGAAARRGGHGGSSTDWLTIRARIFMFNHMVEGMTEIDAVFHALATGPAATWSTGLPAAS